MWIRRTGHPVPTILRYFVSFVIYTLAFFGIVAFVYDQRLTGLLATSGLGQVRADGTEVDLLTSGEHFDFLPSVMNGHPTDYHARDVLKYLLGS